MQPPPAAHLISDFWAQQASWSKAANRQKRSIGRVRAAALLSGVLSAVLGAAAAQAGSAHAGTAAWCAFGAAIAAGAVPLLNGQVGRRRIQDWTRLRSVSEAFKAEIYTYLAKAGPRRSPAFFRKSRSDRSMAASSATATTATSGTSLLTTTLHYI
ncbi:DUF4231 domain-containing protein [Streptomyces beihaiensis]|uniref:DUF4231 domain-containing protein n=1 Tax=Streptomyces beihaiensis TaxID=2984495 RepID=A0ABT3TMP1_9ACTN|nr:DUF4231 domain-containing protein [Streptomyces beihaiensis]MCX3058271.1 DUF4231 domain-containing protein [Streptomyces beihaiensis]